MQRSSPGNESLHQGRVQMTCAAWSRLTLYSGVPRVVAACRHHCPLVCALLGQCRLQPKSSRQDAQAGLEHHTRVTRIGEDLTTYATTMTTSICILDCCRPAGPVYSTTARFGCMIELCQMTHRRATVRAILQPSAAGVKCIGAGSEREHLPMVGRWSPYCAAMRPSDPLSSSCRSLRSFGRRASQTLLGLWCSVPSDQRGGIRR